MKPRIAIHNPAQLSVKANHTIYAYVIEYIKKYRPLIYLSKSKKPLRYFFWGVAELTPEGVLQKLKDCGITYDRSMIITDVGELNARADILISFNGENFINTPERNFHGMKVYHTQDFQAYCTDNYNALIKGKVDYIFGTGQLDKYSPLFRKTYPNYVGKVISFPFGYSSRFKETTPLHNRINKALATGSVNPIRIQDYPTHDVLTTRDNKIVHVRPSLFTRVKFWAYYHLLITESTREFVKHWKGERWVHPFRRMIVEHEDELKDIVVNKLPIFPQIKRYDFDLVKEFNRHKMSVVDDGLIEIVGAKAYESIACGCVLVCPDLPYYEEWGFIDGKNCIKYKDRDFQDFKKKVNYYLKHQGKLAKIQQAGKHLVLKRYSHRAIASMINTRLLNAYKDWRRHGNIRHRS